MSERKHKMSRRARNQHAVARRRPSLASPLLPKAERLKPIAMVARLIVTLKSAPRASVVDAGFDAICRMHGYIPMRVLGWLKDEGYVFVDDRHPVHKIITLTRKGWSVGAPRRST
ncbi:hypothetical protein LCGC14_1281990 [marine sediment metagenome]|uniref:Uncharacterized protein n=1 Tax=marine sediment metagenome TaxID=412755 RepID=A0A0F9KUY5_9ZZZZ